MLIHFEIVRSAVGDDTGVELWSAVLLNGFRLLNFFPCNE